jgi:hypothetical protein
LSLPGDGHAPRSIVAKAITEQYADDERVTLLTQEGLPLARVVMAEGTETWETCTPSSPLSRDGAISLGRVPGQGRLSRASDDV